MISDFRMIQRGYPLSRFSQSQDYAEQIPPFHPRYRNAGKRYMLQTSITCLHCPPMYAMARTESEHCFHACKLYQPDTRGRRRRAWVRVEDFVAVTSDAVPRIHSDSRVLSSWLSIISPFEQLEDPCAGIYHASTLAVNQQERSQGWSL